MRICTYEKCGRETKTLTKGLCPTCYARYQRNGTPEHIRPNRSLGITQCSFCEGKDGPFVKSLCGACYQRQYKNGTPEMQRVRHLCEVPGCNDLVAAHGLCQRHAARVRRHGSVDAGRPEGWGQKEKHPMYEAYKSMLRGAKRSGGYDPRWKDFWVFLEEMGERPTERSRLYREDKTKPFSKENCEWRAGIGDAGLRARASEYQKAYRLKRPGILQRIHRKKLYGIVDDWYERTFAAQGGVCAICHCPETQKHAKTGEIIALAIDHNDDTGELRG